MFEKVLIANRGEIAVRITRTLRRLGARTVAVHTDTDAADRHVQEADLAVRLHTPERGSGYLDIGQLVDAARASGAEAVHPGYGFLAENAEFARAVTAAGLTFIGPPPDAVELMGDKIHAKLAAERAGCPTVPGTGADDDGGGLDDSRLADAARTLGGPVLLKPAAGGGGKGMRLVREPDQLLDEIAAARREARASFGDDTLLVERWIDRPRHVEIQVLADAHGHVVHLGERECSLQRRHQKIIEEAPSPLLDAESRAAMGADAVRVAQACGYTGVGTVEFIVGDQDPGSYFFMEMNTRLQVEHPVTEQVVTVRDQPGLDLVEQQLRVAAGEPLPFSQDDVRLAGHAVEARVCAETVSTRGGSIDFLPTGGRILALREPHGPGVRVDSGLAPGMTIGSDYDPMLAKVTSHAADRPTALRGLSAALSDTAILGTVTNIAFLRRLLAHPDVRSGRLDTGLIERDLPSLAETVDDPALPVAAALTRQLALAPAPDEHGWIDPFSLPTGWRPGEPAWTTHRLRLSSTDPNPRDVRVRGTGPDFEVSVDEGPIRQARAELSPAAPRTPGEPRLLRVELDRVRRDYLLASGSARPGDSPEMTLWLGREGTAHPVQVHDPVDEGEASAGTADGALTAPMPGTVALVKAATGEPVTAGQTLLVVEAMKMEHPLTAPFDGALTELRVRQGDAVAMDDVLAIVSPAGNSTSTAETDSAETDTAPSGTPKRPAPARRQPAAARQEESHR